MLTALGFAALACTTPGENRLRLEVIEPRINLMSDDQPVIVDLRDLDVDAWLPTLRATTPDGTELTLDVQRWDNLPSIVEIRVVDPPHDVEVAFAPNQSGNVFWRAYYDDSLAGDVEAPAWGRSRVRFVEDSSDRCYGTHVVMDIRPPIDDVLYEVVGSDGQVFLGPPLVVENRYGRVPAGSYDITLVDAHGNRSDTLTVDYQVSGCTTSGRSWHQAGLAMLGRRR